MVYDVSSYRLPLSIEFTNHSYHDKIYCVGYLCSVVQFIYVTYIFIITYLFLNKFHFCTCRSKNKLVSWYADSIRGATGRQPARNIMRVRPGPTRHAARNIDSIESSFNLFMTTTVINIVIKWTNKEGRLVHGNDWKDVDATELKCFVGLLLLAGVFKAHNEAIMSLWNLEDGRPIFNKSMPRNRFSQICQCLRFDDAASRRHVARTDKLAPIRDLFETWVGNLQACFVPNDNVTVDEQLVTFRGKCPFKQYIPSKPGKYGIKLWACCDSNTSYVYNIQVYTGKGANEGREINQGQRVVLDMVKGLENSGRNITCDNFFTSLNLARELDRLQLTILGTIRRNKPELPAEITESKGRIQFSSKFVFQDLATVVSYCPKKGKLVILLSTTHSTASVQDSDKAKPQMIIDYNATKSWPMIIFYNMLDISALNAFILWMYTNPNWNEGKRYKRRLFLLELGKSLVKESTGKRLKLPITTTTSMKGTKRGRCTLCSRSVDRKHSSRCSKCNNFTCAEHLLCAKCVMG